MSKKSRMNATDLQKKSNRKKTTTDTKKINPRTVSPYKKRVNLKPEIADKLIKKIKFEADRIEKELRRATPGLHESDAVRYRQKKADKVYKQKVDYTEWPFQDASNIPGIIITSSVDSLRGSVSRALKVDPLVMPVGELDREVAIQKQKHVEEEVRTRIPNALEMIKAAVHDGLLRGVGFNKRYEVIEVKGKRRNKKYKGQKGLKDFLKDYDSEDHPDIVFRLTEGEEITLREIEESENKVQKVEYVNPENMLVGCDVVDINDADFVGEKTTYTPEQIIEEDFDNIEDLFSGDLEDIELEDEEIDVIHCEIMFDYKGDGKRRKMLCSLATEKDVLLLTEEHPNDNGHSIYIPYFSTQYAGNFWRDGFYDKLKAVHQTHKEIIDIVLNSSYVSMVPTFKAKNKGTFDPSIQNWYPGAVWWLDNLDDVVPMPVDSPQLGFDRWADKIQQFGYELSGQSPYTQGSPVHAGESGEKVKTLLAAGGIRTEEVIENINKGLNELYFQILEAAKHGNFTEKLIIDDEEKLVSPEIFEEGNHKYLSSLDIASVNPDMILQRTMLVMEHAANNPIMQQSLNPEKMSEIAKEFFRSVGFGWEDKADELVMTPKEMREREMQMRIEMQQRQQEQAMAQQAEQLAEGLDEEDLRDVQQRVQQQGAQPPPGVI